MAEPVDPERPSRVCVILTPEDKHILRYYMLLHGLDSIDVALRHLVIAEGERIEAVTLGPLTNPAWPPTVTTVDDVGF